ncbi:MAG: hypothetical protein QOF43_2124, partial [Gaiellaceae bacterium]|nr:hypothetical protein [Gaiellaceae bacterium]
MRHLLRNLNTSGLRMAFPKAGSSVLTSAVTLASVLWVSVSLPNMPLLGSLSGDNGTSVAISLQSALLGIDDGNGRRPRDAHALALALGV